MYYTVQDYVRICDDIYYPEVEFYYPDVKKDSIDNIPNEKGYYKNSFLQEKHGWVRKYFSKLDSKGFFAAYYVRGNNFDEGIIAFRGSDDFYDFAYHDFKLALGEWPEAYNKALLFYKEIIKTYSPKFLAFTGHSLGGALAQLVGIEANNTRFSNLKYPVVCFNAPQMGYLIRYNPNKKSGSNITGFIDSIFSTLNAHKSSPNSRLAKSNFTSKIVSSLPSIFSNVDMLYKHMISYKNLDITVEHEEPAFNVVYDLLTSDFIANIKNKNLFNKVNYEENILKCEKIYNYIFNFNSFFDLVNTVGIPLGNKIVVDIDSPENTKHWLLTGQNKLFHDHNDYLESNIYKSRLRCELRTMITQMENYFELNDSKYNFSKDYTRLLRGSYKVHENLSCSVNLKNYLGHSGLNATDIFKLLPGVILDIKGNFSSEYVNDLSYISNIQHSIKNLGNVILNNKDLSSLTIGKHIIDKPNYFKKYKSNNPNINFKENINERLEYIISKLDLKEITRATSCTVNSVKQQFAAI